MGLSDSQFCPLVLLFMCLIVSMILMLCGNAVQILHSSIVVYSTPCVVFVGICTDLLCLFSVAVYNPVISLRFVVVVGIERLEIGARGYFKKQNILILVDNLTKLWGS